MVVTMARTLDIKGFVQNLPNGKVFIIAEGPKEDLPRFVRSIWIDDCRIKVEDIFTDCKDARVEFNGHSRVCYLTFHNDKGLPCYGIHKGFRMRIQ